MRSKFEVGTKLYFVLAFSNLKLGFKLECVICRTDFKKKLAHRSVLNKGSIYVILNKVAFIQIFKCLMALDYLEFK